VAVDGGPTTVLVSAIDVGSLTVDGGDLFVDNGNWVGRIPASGGAVTIYGGRQVYGAMTTAGGTLYVGNTEGTIVRVTPE
jgi:hypothetical protein